MLSHIFVVYYFLKHFPKIISNWYFFYLKYNFPPSLDSPVKNKFVLISLIVEPKD